MAMCEYLYNNCKKETLSDLCLQVENGLTKQECLFSDVFLFLFQKFDQDKFNETIESVTKHCLNSKNKDDIKSYRYFKNNLLKSNIWATYQNSSNNNNNDNNINNNYYYNSNINIYNNESQYNYDEQKNKDHDKQESEKLTVWGKISQVLESCELKQEQEKLKQELIKLENDFQEHFDYLKNNIKKFNLAKYDALSQNKLSNMYNPSKDFMNDENGIKGVQPDKKLTELAIDFESGFYGKSEYDYKIYLTNVLIVAHQINPIFQKECKNIFDKMKQQNVLCDFRSAPVKTYQRCQNKAKTDYCDREWPRTSHILDFIRCSVIFDDIGQFIRGFNLFYKQYYDWTYISKRRSCIKCIVRIKNDFSELPNNLKDLALKDSEYRDIKCNVLIQHNNVRIIGEIQFVLRIMLNAKKKGHKIYQLMRKKELFEHLNQLYYQDDIYNYLKEIIMNHNMNQLSLFCQTMTESEKKYFENDKNKAKVTQVLKLCHFDKGSKLFAQFVN